MTILTTLFTTLAQQDDGGAAGGSMGTIIGLIVGLLVIAGLWKIFTKAGQPGWAAIVPIYNYYILLKTVGRPGWWLLLFLIPVVNLIVVIIVLNDLSKSFGKGVGFTIGLILLSFIFIPLLGFGDARYLGPAAGAGTPAMAHA
jgi:hypothetical protein